MEVNKIFDQHHNNLKYNLNAESILCKFLYFDQILIKNIPLGCDAIFSWEWIAKRDAVPYNNLKYNS